MERDWTRANGRPSAARRRAGQTLPLFRDAGPAEGGAEELGGGSGDEPRADEGAPAAPQAGSEAWFPSAAQPEEGGSAGAFGGGSGAERAARVSDLSDLNPAQRAAVLHGEGPLLILAGPGSGKTRVVTRRIAWLVQERGVWASRILAITFTNKAAREMRERVDRLLPPGESGRIWIGTFHGTCARILRRDVEALSPEEGGRTRDFTIYDTHDKNQLLKELIKAGGWDQTRFKPAVVGGWISERKNRHAAPQEEAWDEAEDEGIEGEVLRKVRRAYEEAMRKANALDFDDLLLTTLALFEHHPGVRDQYAERFLHVMVDEYQDTNRVQYLLARHLASGHENLAVCGDPDQSIYAWRGADIRNILAFEEDYPAATVVRLEQNYRSVGNVLAAAQAVIGHNLGRKPKDLWSEREKGELLAVIECGDENDEASEVVRQIQGLRARGIPPGEVAIFYRVNFMQRALETQLRLAGVPYQIVGGVEFYQRREIRDLIGYLRLAVNPADDVALARVVNVPARGVGETTLARLGSWAADRRLPLSAALRSAEAMALVRGRAKAGLEAFVALLDELSDLRERPAAEALERVLALSGYEGWLAQTSEDEDGGVDRQANVDELRTHAQTYDAQSPEGKLAGFLQDVALVSDVDSLQEDSGGKVTLMTLHSAKGLEFGAVFLAGCEEELLPHARALAESAGSEGLEEERRLFYVGMTRAKERLVMTWARRRLHYGQELFRQPSRFLEELPRELVEGLDEALDEHAALGRFEPPPQAPGADLAVGDWVKHDHFGLGNVLALAGRGANARATVAFREHGTKQLLLQYAKLEKLGSKR